MEQLVDKGGAVLAPFADGRQEAATLFEQGVLQPLVKLLHQGCAVRREFVEQ
jgi:hypothetical protein